MGSVFESISNDLFGEPGKAHKSGAFTDMEGVGKGVGSLLMHRLNTPIEDQERFQLAYGGMKSQAVASASQLRDRLGKRFGGALDSGAVIDMEMAIARDGLNSLTQGYGQLYQMFDQSTMSDAFQYLSQASGEHQAISLGNMQSKTEARGQNVQAYAATMEAVASMFGGMMGCWVARSIYGPLDIRWVLARHYVQFMGPGWFLRAYMKFGERVAFFMEDHPWAKKLAKPLFDRFWKKALREVCK